MAEKTVSQRSYRNRRAILLGVDILLTVVLALIAVFGLMYGNFSARIILLQHQKQAIIMTNTILHDRSIEPLKTLASFDYKKNLAQLFETVKKYPEIAEINLFDEAGKYKPLFTGVTKVKTHDEITKSAFAIHDTLSTQFNKARWDTAIWVAHIPAKVENQDYIFSFMKSGGNTVLLVLDPSKLLPQLAEVFANGQQNPYFPENYFDKFNDYQAQIRLLDSVGKEVFSYGNSTGKGYDKTSDKALNWYPWKLTVGIHCQQEMLIASALAAGKVPWSVVVLAVMLIVSVLLTVFYLPKSNKEK